MKKAQFTNGLNDLLAPTPTTPVTAEPTTQAAAPKYKTVCYSIPPEIAEKMRVIAYWDRKKINAVVIEAFTQYATKWEKANPNPR